MVRLSEQVEQLLEARSVPAKAAFAAQLAIDELVSNIVRYGTGCRGEVEIRFVFEEAGVAIEIEHDGDRFNPFESAEPPLDLPMEERPIGGLGIHLTRRLMDHCDYSYRDGRNFMVVRKKFALDGSE